MSREDEIKQLITEHNRRLQLLKVQQAQHGISVEPKILIEIEDIEAELAVLQAELDSLDQAPRFNPYRGLSAFREEDAPFFFGRETFTAQLVESVQQKPLVAVLGPSGSGKSSIVFAGLLPHLRREGHWLITSFRPGKDLFYPNSDPFRALAAALLPHLEPEMTETGRLVETDKLATALSQGKTRLSEVVARILEKHPTAKHLLLIADQFEELYTLCPDLETRQQFLDALLQALPLYPLPTGPPIPLRLVLTLRADFLSQALAYRPFADALREADVKLGPMNRDELRRTIEEPAITQEVSFEPGLVEWMVADVTNEPGHLPLLEFALTALWDYQSGQSSAVSALLTHATYEAVGRVEGALSRHAEQVFASLSTADKERARRVFVQLVQPGQGTEDTRRLASRVELDEADWALVQNLAAESARLVVTDQDTNGRETVEVIHEALIGSWGRLRDWMDTDRVFRAWQERLRATLHQWQATGQDEGALLRGAPLAEAEGWMAEREDRLSATEREFIQASVLLRGREQMEKEAQRQREVEQARKLSQRAKWIIGVGIVAMILAIVAVVFGVLSRQNAAQAEKEARKATSRGLAVASIDNFDKDINRSLLLAMYAISETHTIEAENALRQALQASRLQFTLSGNNGAVYDVTFNPDGTRLVTTGDDGLVNIWDTVTGQKLQTLSGHKDKVYGAAFNPTGTALATASGDGTVRIWDTSTGRETRVLSRHADAVLDVTFNADGTRLATAGQDKTVRVWDITSGQELLTLTGSTTRTRSIDFSPDGVYLATGWDDGIAKIWEVTSGNEVLKLSSHSAPINDIEFSRDGKRLVTGSDDSSIIIWDTSSGNILQTLEDNSRVYGVNLKYPTGRYLITSNQNGEVKLWDIDSGKEMLTISSDVVPQISDESSNWIYRIDFTSKGMRVASASRDGIAKIWAIFGGEALVLGGHTDRVRDVNFSPNGQRLVTASWDGTGKVWDAKSGKELLTLKGHHDVLVHINFSPDGTRLVTASDDETAKVWDSTTGEELFTLKHPHGVHDVTFSPDGMSIATTNLSGTVKIWDAVSGESIVTLPAHNEIEVLRAAFSPDGKRLATAGMDKTVKVWDTTTWEVLHTISGHIGGVDGVVFSPDGRLLATASSDNTAKVWDAVSGEEIFTLLGHSQQLGDVIFSPDGMHLATASEDKTVKIWDTVSGEEKLTLFGHLDGVNELAFSPDGKHLATAGGDGVVLVHSLDIDELMNLAQSRLIRPLRSEECQRYLRQNPCPTIPN